MTWESDTSWRSLVDECRPWCFWRTSFSTFVRLLGANVRLSKTQKSLPPSWGRLGRPERKIMIIFIIIYKKLFLESGGGPLLVVVVRVNISGRHQPSLEEKLISTHHGVVCHWKLEVWRHWRVWSGWATSLFLQLHGLLHIHKIIWERDSWAHWSALMMMVMIITLVVLVVLWVVVHF